MKKRYLKCALLVSTTGIVLAAGTMPANAQQEDPAPNAVADPDPVDIVVTAQRRSENVMDVPVSVTVIGAEALADNGINDLSGVTKFAPTLQVGQDNQFSIRGIGTGTFADTVEASVTQVIDDVVLGSRYFASNGFYDVERVEVLGGPQGLLFGKNASAGVVNITTSRPELGETSASFDVEATSRYRPGSDGLGVRVRSTVNVPVGENSALRLNASYSSQDGITRITNITAGARAENDIENFGIRAKFLTEPTSNLSVYLIGEYSEFSGIAGSFDFTHRALGAGSQYSGILSGAGITPGPRNLESAVNAPFFKDLTTGGVQANITLELANGMEISNIAAWKSYSLDQLFDSDFTPVNFFDTNGADSTYEQFSNELRVTLPDSELLSGQFGTYYFYSDNSFSGARGGNNGFPGFLLPNFPFCVGAAVTAGPPPACNVSNVSFLGQDYAGNNTNESIAAFGQLSLAVSDTLSLTAGARVTHDRVTLDLLENVNPYFVTLGLRNNHFTGSTTHTNFSWKLGADWEPTPDTLVYGFFGRGYKGPGFSNAAPAPNASLAVEPEISTSAEIGVKQTLFDRRLAISISAFYTEFDDLQVQAFDTALRTVVLGNAARATTNGIDFNLQARPIDGLTLGLAATFLDASYDEYPGRQCYASQTTASCAVNGTFDASGLRVTQSARFTTVVTADYEFPLSESLEGTIGGSYFHRSSVLTDYAPGTRIPTWDTFDSAIGLQADNWRLSLFCKNCFNSIRPISVEAEAGDGVNVGTLTLVQRWGFDSVRTTGIRFGFDF